MINWRNDKSVLLRNGSRGSTRDSDWSLRRPQTPVKPPAEPSPERRYRQPLQKERVSIGVACCRHNSTTGKYEILVILKRYSYAYNVFVHGNYNSNDNQAIIKLFNEMTVEEKLDILSLNFVQIWYRIWLDTIAHTTSYLTAKGKYESAFGSDGGVRLRSLVNKSTSAPRVWEIPKGRRKTKGEPEITCAVREFKEETGIGKNRYKLYTSAKRVSTYVDAGIKYTNIYYLAHVKNNNLMPRVNFARQEQINEISDIKWMDTDAMRYVDSTGRLAESAKHIIGFMKKRTH